MPTTTEDATTWPNGLLAAYEEHWLPLVRLAALLTRDPAVAEELVQDAFVAARGRWSTIQNPGGYLRTSVVNATRDWGRHQQVVRRHDQARADRLEASVAFDAPDELWDALGRLDEARRSVIVLRFYLDLPDAEIAELLGCRPSTVRTRIHRALRDLRREVTP